MTEARRLSDSGRGRPRYVADPSRYSAKLNSLPERLRVKHESFIRSGILDFRV